MTSTGRSRYCKPNMAHASPGTTRTDTMPWERRIWVDRVASLSNFRDHVPGDIPFLDNQQPAPSMYMAFMYNKHNTLSTTHYQAPSDTWSVHGTDSLLPANYIPPPHSPSPHRYTRPDKPDDPHFWCTWGRKSLGILLLIRSGNLSFGRAMYCLAKPTERSWQSPPERLAWNVTLRFEQTGAPLKRTGPTNPASDPHVALLNHCGSPPHDPALARPGHPQQTLPLPHRGGYAGHPAVLLQNPRLPPAVTPTRPGAAVYPHRVSQQPAHPR